jgi:hypothetical protein
MTFVRLPKYLISMNIRQGMGVQYDDLYEMYLEHAMLANEGTDIITAAKVHFQCPPNRAYYCRSLYHCILFHVEST